MIRPLGRKSRSSVIPLSCRSADRCSTFPARRRRRRFSSAAPFSFGAHEITTRLALLASTRRLTAINGKPIRAPACRRSSARLVSSRNLISSRELTYSPVHERSNSSSRNVHPPGRLLRRARGTAATEGVPLEGSRLRPGITAKDRATRGRGK